MSDNQRRAACRILFLLLCVFPTSTIGYWICHPQTVGGWERTIQAQLGVTTKIDSVETPGPYVTILRGLEFFDPDGKTIFDTVTTRIEFGREFNQIVIPSKINGLTNEGLDYLVQSLNQHVIRQRSAEKHWIVVLEKNATVEKAQTGSYQRPVGQARFERSVLPLPLSSQLTISELFIEVGPTRPKADGAYANAKFKLVGSDGRSTSEKFVECNSSRTDQFGQFMEVKTNDLALPCWLFANRAIDLPSKLGQEATFNGVVRYEPTSTSANLQLAGDFEKVNLNAAVTGIGQSNASIHLSECKFENGELAKWNAVLYPDANSSPKRIDAKHLFTYASQLDIAGAIIKARLGPEVRLGQRESDTNYH